MKVNVSNHQASNGYVVSLELSEYGAGLPPNIQQIICFTSELVKILTENQ
jgi:hypothetical protein